MPTVSSDLDLDLFITQASWATGALKDRSVSGMTQWICSQMDAGGDLSQFLLNLLRLDAPEQITAERRLCDILPLSYTSQVPQRVVQDTPGRSVDWSETYMRSHTGPPTKFVSRHSESRPDMELMGALQFQAEQWRDLLRSSTRSIHADRADRLHNALMSQTVDPASRYRRPLTPSLLHRLRQCGPHSAQAAEAMSRVFAHQHSRPEHVLSAIQDAFSSVDGWWNRKRDARASPWNHLLEVSALTAITRTAAQSEFWQVREYRTAPTFAAHLEHVETPLHLAIQKSPPGSDAFTSVRAQAGMTKHRGARDSQPDICLTFTHAETGASISALGDTKRNATGDDQGANYFRDGLRTATYYLSAYADAVDLRLVEGTPVGALRPTFTLFFRQGIEPDHPAQPALQSSSPKDLPPILALDIEHHFGLQEDDPSRFGEWHATLLDDWLIALTDQATRNLVSTLSSRRDT